MSCLLLSAASSSLSFFSLSRQIKPFPATLQRIISMERLRAVLPKQELLLTPGRVASSSPSLQNFHLCQASLAVLIPQNIPGLLPHCPDIRVRVTGGGIAGVLTTGREMDKITPENTTFLVISPSFQLVCVIFFRFWPFPTLAFCGKLLKT